MTNRLADEWAEQRRWRRKPEFESFQGFDVILENEFIPPEEHEARLVRQVRSLVRFAVEQVPYYARLFADRGLEADDIAGPQDLAKVPTLTKHDLIEFRDDLWARTLPPGEAVWGQTRSSGTTGRSVAVLHTQRSNAMFAVLGHRHARWRRLDPMGTRLDVRQRRDVYAGMNGGTPPDYIRLPQWRYLGRCFHTGDEYAFPVSSPMERQVAMLRELQPDYAMSFPGVFEEWLFANEGKRPVDSLKCLIGVGSQLTPSLRARLESGFGVPVHMAYGLNEIGAVAVRCENGRYHVHTEHCLVQISAADGKPCAPGEVGHVLVTGLTNYAMPLIRYDTGDLAEAVDGTCGCGRTLPSFGEIAGRYRRYAGLPEGTRERVRAIRSAIEESSPAELAFLRRYQIHQDLENRFTLRLRTAAPIPDAFRTRILAAWANDANSRPLAIVELDEIGTSPGGKLLDFVSEFHTDSAHASRPLNGSQPIADI
jgi:phenylacetate-CoA ligase